MTVYVEVIFGVTVIELFIEGRGDHVKLPPAISTELVIVVLEPIQMVSLKMDTTGLGFTTIPAETLGETQPFELV